MMVVVLTLLWDTETRGKAQTMKRIDAQAGRTLLLRCQEDARVRSLPQIQHRQQQLHQDRLRDRSGANYATGTTILFQ